METPIIVALIAGTVTAIGWLVNHILADQREQIQQQKEVSLKYVEQQLEELYGPLAFLLYEGRRTFVDLLDTLDRNFVFFNNQPLPENELKTWLFWVEKAFIPRNEEIKRLLMSKPHLIEGSKFPKSYVAFLDHHNSWMIRHKRWKEEGVEYSWHSKINWPREFEQEVIETFEVLKEKHSVLLGELLRSKQR